MAHYNEAKQWMHDQVYGKFVYCKLTKKDQYGRIVSVHPFP